MHQPAMVCRDLAAGHSWELLEAMMQELPDHFCMEPQLPLLAWKPWSLLLLHHPKDVVRFKLRSNLDLKFRSFAMDSQSRQRFAIDFKGDKLSLLTVCMCVL